MSYELFIRIDYLLLGVNLCENLIEFGDLNRFIGISWLIELLVGILNA